MGCNHDCENCSSSCGTQQDLHEELNPQSSVKHVIGVVSGKGGVGKSMVTTNLAVTLNRLGKKVAILDADITGPSIPKAFGIKEKCMGSDFGIFPAETVTGIKLISINLLLENDTDPVVWRAPMIVGTVKQFWTDVIWDDIDYMFVDLPPGTGDIPLTVFWWRTWPTSSAPSAEKNIRYSATAISTRSQRSTIQRSSRRFRSTPTSLRESTRAERRCSRAITLTKPRSILKKNLINKNKLSS